MTLSAWVIILNVGLNFIYGVMLPLIPTLNVENAGFAFSAFALAKVFCLPFAGIIGDRIGHSRGLALTLILQVVALICMLVLPEFAWIGRIFEGAALAQGMVSAVSLLRIKTSDPMHFSKSISRLMSGGALGFIVGPLLGYLLLPWGSTLILLILLGVSGVLLGAHLLRFVTLEAPVAAAQESVPRMPRMPRMNVEFFDRSMLFTVLGFAAAKVLGVGLQPNLAWWANHDVGLSATLSGASFILMGVGFAVGAAKQFRGFGYLPILGLLFLELAIHGQPAFWWGAVPLLGYWFGCYVTTAVSKLGWNRPENIGRFNSKWMLFTDFPMALVPMLVWQWRAPEPSASRLLFELGFAVLALSGLSRRNR
ncbi:MFS transporter [Bdellovibrionota bacterium FG-2]